jgi:hypothetical protein
VRLQEPVTARITVEILPVPVQRAVLNVPVRFHNIGRGLSAQSVPPVVTVLTKGRKEVLDELRADAVGAFVDLAGLGPGRYNLPVRVAPPQDYEVLRIQPARVRVRVVR